MANSETLYVNRFLISYSWMRYLLLDQTDTVCPGIVLIFDDKNLAKHWVMQYEKIGLAVQYEKLKKNDTSLCNYQIGAHIYRKNDDDVLIERYMERRDFMPVLIICGMVPKDLEVSGNFIFRISEEIPLDTLKKMSGFKNWIIDNIEVAIREIKLANSSKYAIRTREDALYTITLAISCVYRSYIRKYIKQEYEADEKTKIFHDWIVQSLDNADRLTGVFHITEAVRTVLLNYISENPIRFIRDSDKTEKEYGEEDYLNTIRFSEEYYFIPEKLLEKICSPLLHTTSFLQIKNELYTEGTLICDDSEKRNFTVKIIVYKPENAKNIKKRFLRLKREVFEMDLGVFPDEFYSKRKEDIVYEC